MISGSTTWCSNWPATTPPGSPSPAPTAICISSGCTTAVASRPRRCASTRRSSPRSGAVNRPLPPPRCARTSRPPGRACYRCSTSPCDSTPVTSTRSRRSPVQLLRLGPIGQERPYVRAADGTVHDLSSVTADLDGAFFASDGIARARSALEAGSLPAVDVEGLRVGAPIARPGAVVCIGQNYAAHAAESGAEPPVRPIIFFKHPNTVVGPYDDVLIPRNSTKTDWEVELAVVIGRTARYVESDEAALACIAGYAVSNDVSERDFQLTVSGGQWSKGKSSETFNPLGPALIP